MRMAYYPGCSLDATAAEYGLSTERMAKKLGIDLWEIPDWSCCGASSAHQTDHLLAVSLPARNLAIAEKEGLDVLAPCAACYNRFRGTEHEVRTSEAVRADVEKVIGMEYRATNKTVSVLELLVDQYGLPQLEQQVVNPLRGMKPACYYGCLLVRPQKVTGFDDPEDPTSMDRIMRSLGASPVEWSGKSECCSAGLAQTKPEMGAEVIYRLIKKAMDAGADSFVTACPICMINLDMRQKAIEKKYKIKINMPVYYVTELVAVACGDKPQDVGIKRHFVEAVSFFAGLPSKAAELAAQEAMKKSGGKEAKEKDAGEAKPAPKAEAKPKAKAEKDPEVVEECSGEDNVQLLFALKLYDDEEKAMILAEILTADEAKMTKLAEMLEQDKAKALKVADALVNKALKQGSEKPAGEEGKA